jgi:hypothetical protein
MLTAQDATTTRMRIGFFYCEFSITLSVVYTILRNLRRVHTRLALLSLNVLRIVSVPLLFRLIAERNVVITPPEYALLLTK